MRFELIILVSILLLGSFQLGKSAVCNPLIENALECGTSGGTQIVTKCVDRFDGIIFYPYDSSGSTTIKPTQCDVCVKETLARTTDTASQKVCVLCSAKVSNCVECRGSDNRCFKCATGFYLQDNDGDGDYDSCVSACPSGWFSLASTSTDGRSVCKQCSSQIPYCSVCSAQADTCTTCQSGYFLSLDGKTCMDCKDSFVFVNSANKCDLCINSLSNCVECNGNKDQCVTCQENFYLKVDGSKTVCDACPLSSTTYFRVGSFNGKGSCVLCNSKIPNCVNCEFEGTRCTKCAANFYLFSSAGNEIYDSCVSAPVASPNQGLLTLSTLTNGAGVVIRCDQVIEGCRFCRKDGTDVYCNECHAGLTKFSTVNDYSKINRCLRDCNFDGYYFDNADGVCKLCSNAIPNCMSCQGNPVTCDRCASGFWRYSKQDSEFFSECTKCDSTDRFKENMGDDGSNVCRNCNYGTMYAIECERKLSYTDYKVNQCDADKGSFPKIDVEGWASECTSCNDGTGVQRGDAPNVVCKACGLIYSNCELCNNEECLVCATGYFRTILPGKTKYQDCTKCNIPGQTIENTLVVDGTGRCVPTFQVIPNCQLMNGRFCVKCDEKYSLYSSLGDGLSDRCVFCNLPALYQENPAKIDGTGQCLECSSAIFGCLECSDKSSCTRCAPGLFLQKSNITQANFDQCVSCSSKSVLRSDPVDITGAAQCLPCYNGVPGCQDCYGSAKSCNRCQNGLFLQSTNNDFIFDACKPCEGNTNLILNTTVLGQNYSICQPCDRRFDGCATCNVTHCLTCKEGLHFLMPWKKACVSCDNPKVQYITKVENQSSTCSFYPYEASYKVNQIVEEKVAELEFSCTDAGFVYFAIGLQGLSAWEKLGLDEIKTVAKANEGLKSPLSLIKEKEIVYGSFALKEPHQIVKVKVSDVNFDNTYIIVKHCENLEELAGPKQVDYISLVVTGNEDGPRFNNIDIVKVWVPVVLIIVFVLMLLLVVWAKKVSRIQDALSS